jgi:tRNA threonylcarbamoyladenosine biosynthesis protein TsaB
VAICIDGGIREYFEHAPMRHAEILLPAVRKLMSESGKSFSDLDGIAFGRGPGSFTSLRIGIGVVQGLAWGSGLPVVPISSLAAVAQAAVDDETLPGARLLVAMDARMGEVYTASFVLREDGLVEQEGPERVCVPESVRRSGGGEFIAVGNGFERFESLRNARREASRWLPGLWPTATAVCRLARDWLQDNEPLPAAAAQPVYLRNEVAKKSMPSAP